MAIEATSPVTITEPIKTVGTAGYFQITGFTYVDNFNTKQFNIDCSVGNIQERDGSNNPTKVNWLKSWTVSMTPAEMAAAISTLTTGGTLYAELKTLLYSYLVSKGEIPVGF